MNKKLNELELVLLWLIHIALEDYYKKSFYKLTEEEHDLLKEVLYGK